MVICVTEYRLRAFFYAASGKRYAFSCIGRILSCSGLILTIIGRIRIICLLMIIVGKDCTFVTPVICPWDIYSAGKSRIAVGVGDRDITQCSILVIEASRELVPGLAIVGNHHGSRLTGSGSA